jgi:transposase-like protein
MVDGVFPGKESCVVVALAIDIDGNKHLLDFEEGSSMMSFQKKDQKMLGQAFRVSVISPP